MTDIDIARAVAAACGLAHEYRPKRHVPIVLKTPHAGRCFNPCHDIADAFLAAEAVGLFSRPHHATLSCLSEGRWCVQWFRDADGVEEASETADTPAKAISLAILKLKGAPTT